MPYRALYYILERRQKTIDRKELEAVYRDLRNAIEVCTEREINLSSTKRRLKSAEVKLRVAGIEGSNEKTREANLAADTEKFHDLLYEANISTIQARADVEIAKLEVRRTEWTIRLAELNTHTT